MRDKNQLREEKKSRAHKLQNKKFQPKARIHTPGAMIFSIDSIRFEHCVYCVGEKVQAIFTGLFLSLSDSIRMFCLLKCAFPLMCLSSNNNLRLCLFYRAEFSRSRFIFHFLIQFGIHTRIRLCFLFLNITRLVKTKKKRFFFFSFTRV